jgi:UDP-N-acetylglucosamine 2-epimerase (non-hydrolysing)
VENLSDIFLNELRIRKVDHHLGIRAATFGEQAGLILSRMDDLLATIRPDRLLMLGDTNSICDCCCPPGNTGLSHGSR